MDDWFNEKIFKWSRTNEKMTPYKKKGCAKTLLSDFVPIENYSFSLLHA